MNSSLAKNVAVAGIVVALALLLWSTISVFLVLFAGLLVAVFLQSLIGAFLKYTSLGERGAFVTTLVFLAVALGLFGWLFVERIAGQMDELSVSLTASWERVRVLSGEFQWFGELFGQADRVPSALGFGRLAGILNTTLGAVGSLALAAFVGAYIAFDPETYRDGILHLIPQSHRLRAKAVMSKTWETLHWWLLGQLVSMTMIGVGTTVGLLLLGIPLAFVLGLIAFLLTFIPYIGPILSAVPAVLVGLSESGWTALYVGLLYLGIQSVESYLITPMILQRSVRLLPGLTLAAQALMGFLFGVPGLIVATPITACLVVMVRMLYVEDVLNDKST